MPFIVYIRLSSEVPQAGTSIFRFDFRYDLKYLPEKIENIWDHPRRAGIKRCSKTRSFVGEYFFKYFILFVECDDKFFWQPRKAK